MKIITCDICGQPHAVRVTLNQSLSPKQSPTGKFTTRSLGSLDICSACVDKYTAKRDVA